MYINKGKRDILIFPKFKNINKIQELRNKYDPLANLIAPHITIVFPFLITSFPTKSPAINLYSFKNYE